MAAPSRRKTTRRNPCQTGRSTNESEPLLQAVRRTRWRVWQRFMDSAAFVFLDETGAATNMTRLYGWGRKTNASSTRRRGHWRTTIFVAGLRADGVVAPLVLDGPMNGEVFLAYVEQMLVPILKQGDIVVNVLRSARPDISIRRKRKRLGWSDEFARSILGQIR